jgi:hypothetical protein
MPAVPKRSPQAFRVNTSATTTPALSQSGRARALLEHAGPGTRAAGEWLQDAMARTNAPKLFVPPDNDDARLRWNACARVCNDRPELLAREEADGPVMNE